MRDFTLKSYKTLLEALILSKYEFLRYSDYCKLIQQKEPLPNRFIILRHDVDELASNALKIAELEHSLGIISTFYFRRVKQSDVPYVITSIAKLDHEVGYHYEILSETNGNLEKGKKLFEDNLNYFRTYFPVKTVCMHGSSSSKYDNRNFWDSFSISDFNLIGEPYLTTDFTKVFYITDTGYAWDGGKFAVRDIVKNNTGLSFHLTSDIVSSINKGDFPNQVMLLAHTLWTDNLYQWLFLHFREYLRNNIKKASKRNLFVQWLYSKLVSLYWKFSKSKKTK